jgi:hypothetical protein
MWKGRDPTKGGVRAKKRSAVVKGTSLVAAVGKKEVNQFRTFMFFIMHELGGG